MKQMDSRALKEYIPWPFLLVILMVSVLVVTGGFLFYNTQRDKIITEKQNELAAISTLKIENIEKWRMEHLRDGLILSNIIPRNRLMFNFLAHDKSPALKQELLQRMRIFIEDYDYHSLLLIDTTGTIVLSYPPLYSGMNNYFNFKSFDTLSSINLSDLHYSSDLPGMIHLDVQIPLFSAEKTKIGVILLRIDPQKFFFPLIQSWPTPSKSSETMLVKPDGDSVLVLNELRHKKNTALNFKLPYTQKFPSTMAASGYDGIFAGGDYRGVAVISFLKKVPGTPWYMVAKVDKKEIYSPLKNLILAISIIAFLIVFKVTALINYVWKNQRVKYLRELNSTKDKFFSIVSHDMRSPFTSIIGFANILADDLRTKELTSVDLANLKKYAEIIKCSAGNAMDLLRNLTDWSKLNTGRLAFNPKEVDLVKIIDEAIGLMNLAAFQKSITITKATPTSLIIYADKEILSLVLRNLISNSVKFTNPGGKIHISVVQKGSEVRVEVSDTGIGIKKEVLDKLFRIEENISTPGTQREYGTGLGLILVKDFISLHKGHVDVESEYGKSSKFSFTIPMVNK